MAHASVIINEIAWMGNSSNINAEWIELKGEKGTDLSNWTISGSVSITIPEGKKINENGFFLLGRQPVDKKNIYTYVPNFTPDYIYNGALVNTGGDLVLSGSDTDALSFSVLGWPDGYNGDYKTMQWDGNKWIYASPTPGATNSGVSSTDSVDNNTDNTVDETVDPIPVNNNTSVVYKIATKIIAPKIVTAGVPFSIDHTTTGINKEKVILGKFIWNFGDGMSKSGATSDAFNYVYDYPGEYVITLSYGDSTFDTKPDATDRLTIKVIPSGINISSVGTYTDPFVELENKSSYEMSISGWILKGSVHSFKIPEGTVILSNKKLKLSPRITGFDFNDLSSISIIDTGGQVFASFPNYVKPIVKYSANKNLVDNIVKSDVVESSQAQNIGNTPEVINLNDLGANAVGAGSLDNGLNNKTLIYLGLTGIIIIGIISVVLIRRKNDYPDYVDKEIRADDMKIIE